MAQTSTTLISARSHITSMTGTDISLSATSGVYTIQATSTVLTGAGKLAVGDLVKVPMLEQEAILVSIKGKKCLAQLQKLGAIVSFELQ